MSEKLYEIYGESVICDPEYPPINPGKQDRLRAVDTSEPDTQEWVIGYLVAIAPQGWMDDPRYYKCLGESVEPIRKEGKEYVATLEL